MSLDEIKCSFCSKKRSEVQKLISGPKVYICDECVNVCNDLLLREKFAKAVSRYRPRYIFDELQKYVIGQDEAKKYLAVAVYNHYKRLDARKRGSARKVELSKGNILMLGPTGTGKTLLVETLAKKLDVPLAMGDATTLTEAGYVGEDVESLIKSLYRAADQDVEKASRGIIYIDEIDKIARRGTGTGSGRDVSGEGVQQALLKLLEGKIITITPDGGKARNQSPVQIDTTDILFILSGAFNGIEEIIKRRLGDKGMGFGARVHHKEEDKNALRCQVKNEDLYKFGMIPEFMGRVPISVTVNDLREEDLEQILWKPRNSLVAQYKKMFGLEGVELEFTDDAIKTIAHESYNRHMGARGLKAILEDIMLEIMYEIPSMTNVHRCIIDQNVVMERSMPRIELQAEAS
ncbi:ATP-dependent Clp protease ATP-binding subunit ClpX [Myxococcota bacterium]|nr:ATP-dependent Clp protease ATP-binding subunit ClpX [Myxococcota bacterium]MBU1537102.1 ATP-dependent Clp protease ATP-binding subunit ClpX [Myxococcota bacterium]